jgi:hypothetical protein
VDNPSSSSMDEKMPVGVWVQMEVPDQGSIVGFTYVDRQAGFSAQGGTLNSDGRLDSAQRIIVRLPLGVPWRKLTAEETGRLGLETPPSWVAIYGPQPTPGSIWGWWRDHPRLKGRFQLEYPDSLQVLVHDGGPRLTDRHPELIWVSVTGGEGEVFSGRVLNQPHQLMSLSLGSQIRFIVPGGEHPLLVTDKYLAERPAWEITPCNRCGLSELFDAPSDLMRVVFPNTPKDAVMSMFTAFCGACGGILVVKQKGAENELPAPNQPTSPPSPARKWWQFWK